MTTLPEATPIRTAALVLGLVLPGCGAAPHAAPAPKAAGRAITIPAADPAGEPIQAHALFDGPTLEVRSIRLRGVTLPPHRSDAAVVITAAQGTGTVVAGDARLPIDALHGVALAAGVEHAVIPDADGDLVLIVTHARVAVAP